MLPGDYTGPPASAIRGDVLPGLAGVSKEADTPRLSLEWLAQYGNHLAPTPLMGQLVSFTRSSKLQNDWDIGLGLPAEGVKLDHLIAGDTGLRIAVAKMVYFDDRNGDGVLDWSCLGDRCDEVKAIGNEFVVYVENPPYCQLGDGTPARPKLPAGYNYMRFDGASVKPFAHDEALSFTLVDRPLSELNPTASLRAFLMAFLRGTVSALDGC